MCYDLSRERCVKDGTVRQRDRAKDPHHNALHASPSGRLSIHCHRSECKPIFKGKVYYREQNTREIHEAFWVRSVENDYVRLSCWGKWEVSLSHARKRHAGVAFNFVIWLCFLSFFKKMTRTETLWALLEPVWDITHTHTQNSTFSEHTVSFTNLFRFPIVFTCRELMSRFCLCVLKSTHVPVLISPLSSRILCRLIARAKPHSVLFLGQYKVAFSRRHCSYSGKVLCIS